MSMGMLVEEAKAKCPSIDGEGGLLGYIREGEEFGGELWWMMRGDWAVHDMRRIF